MANHIQGRPHTWSKKPCLYMPIRSLYLISLVFQCNRFFCHFWKPPYFAALLWNLAARSPMLREDAPDAPFPVSCSDVAMLSDDGEKTSHWLHQHRLLKNRMLKIPLLPLLLLSELWLISPHKMESRASDTAWPYGHLPWSWGARVVRPGHPTGLPTGPPWRTSAGPPGPSPPRGDATQKAPGQRKASATNTVLPQRAWQPTGLSSTAVLPWPEAQYSLTSPCQQLLGQEKNSSSTWAPLKGMVIDWVLAPAFGHKNHVCSCNLHVCTFYSEAIFRPEGIQPVIPDAANCRTVSQVTITLHPALRWGCCTKGDLPVLQKPGQS